MAKLICELCKALENLIFIPRTLQRVGLVPRLHEGVAPSYPVLREPISVIDAGSFFEPCLAKRGATVLFSGPLDLAQDVLLGEHPEIVPSENQR